MAVGVCEVELEQTGRLVAKGLFTYMYLAHDDVRRPSTPQPASSPTPTP